MTDLQRFLEQHGDALVQIDKPVPLDHVGALTGQTDETVVFNHIDGFPGWRLVDHLFVNRAAQARVLGCDPTEVVPTLAEVLRRGPKPLREVEDAHAMRWSWRATTSISRRCPSSRTRTATRIRTRPVSPSTATPRPARTTRCSRGAAYWAREKWWRRS